MREKRRIIINERTAIDVLKVNIAIEKAPDLIACFSNLLQTHEKIPDLVIHPAFSGCGNRSVDELVLTPTN